jgi:hypothetical protein
MSLFFSQYWQAILTLVFSAVAVLISCLQWKTARKQSETAKKQSETAEKLAQTAKNKLRLELFERRYAVYDALMTMAVIVVGKGDVTFEQRRTCAIATKGAEFLFNKEIDDYCLELVRKAETLNLKKYQMDQSKIAGGEMNPETIESYGDCVLWFNRQVDEMPKRFAEFLKIEG